MGRKSKISRMSPEVRAHIETRLREDRMTLDELFADARDKFPNLCTPSRSALGRFRKSFDEILSITREIQTASQVLVSELGDDFDEQSGILLAKAITVLVWTAADDKLRAGGELEISDVLNLARAAKSAQETRSLSLREREQVAKLAQDKMAQKQQSLLDEMGKSGEVPMDMAAKLAMIIKAGYGDL